MATLTCVRNRTFGRCHGEQHHATIQTLWTAGSVRHTTHEKTKSHDDWTICPRGKPPNFGRTNNGGEKQQHNRMVLAVVTRVNLEIAELLSQAQSTCRRVNSVVS